MRARRLPQAATLLVLAVSLVLASPARADFAGVPDRFRFMIGGTSADFVTEGALIYEPAGAGASVNFEELFDIPTDEQTFRLDGYWRFGERSYLDFGFVQFNREGSKALEQDVTWGEFTLSEGAFVKATWNSNFPYAAYRWAFLPEEKVKISGSAGISYVGIAPTLEADGGVTGPGGPVTGHFEKEGDVALPVPLIGIRLDWAIVDRLELMTFTRFFYLSYEDIFKGGMRETALRLTWDFSQHVGVAVGYDATSLRLKEYDTGDYKAKFTYDITGFSAYATFAF